MAEQIVSGLGVDIVGTDLVAAWGCIVGEFGSSCPCGGVTCLGGAVVFGGGLRAVKSSCYPFSQPLHLLVKIHAVFN